MDSPRTLSANVRALCLRPRLRISIERHPSFSCSTSCPIPAAMFPYMGMSTISSRSSSSGKTTALAFPGTRWMACFFSRARRWFMAAVWLAKPKKCWISLVDGMTPETLDSRFR